MVPLPDGRVVCVPDGTPIVWKPKCPAWTETQLQIYKQYANPESWHTIFTPCHDDYEPHGADIGHDRYTVIDTLHYLQNENEYENRVFMNLWASRDGEYVHAHLYLYNEIPPHEYINTEAHDLTPLEFSACKADILSIKTCPGQWITPPE